jgi:hypothetical protein
VPRIAKTIEELEDAHGIPIVLLTAWDATTRTYMIFRLRDLPLGAIVQIVQWLNDRLSTP